MKKYRRRWPSATRRTDSLINCRISSSRGLRSAARKPCNTFLDFIQRLFRAGARTRWPCRAMPRSTWTPICTKRIKIGIGFEFSSISSLSYTQPPTHGYRIRMRTGKNCPRYGGLIWSPILWRKQQTKVYWQSSSILMKTPTLSQFHIFIIGGIDSTQFRWCATPSSDCYLTSSTSLAIGPVIIMAWTRSIGLVYQMLRFAPFVSVTVTWQTLKWQVPRAW